MPSDQNRINRNILECKVNRLALIRDTSISINRNILECKGHQCCVKWIKQYGINRNILECKDRYLHPDTEKYSVLIETYWNVKEYMRQIAEGAENSINRNILECKVWTVHRM